MPMGMFSQGANPPPPSIPPGAGGGIADRKRRQWTEAAVLALPPGEHDDFERKSGAVVNDSGFYAKLAKTLSAFATSSGGHIILGMTDKGVFDGVDEMRGATRTREWLEQIIPARVDPLL